MSSPVNVWMTRPSRRTASRSCGSPCACARRAPPGSRRRSGSRRCSSDIAAPTAAASRVRRTASILLCAEGGVDRADVVVAGDLGQHVDQGVANAVGQGPGRAKRRGPGTGVKGTATGAWDSSGRPRAPAPAPSHGRRHTRPGNGSSCRAGLRPAVSRHPTRPAGTVAASRCGGRRFGIFQRLQNR